MQLTAKPRCHLLELPPELRNRIYELVVVRDEPVKTVIISDFQHRACFARLQQPRITATCQQIRQESLSIFYTCNSFRFSIGVDYKKDFSTLANYLDIVGESACKQLKDVRLDILSGRLPQAKYLIQFVRLFCRASKCVPRIEAVTLRYMLSSYKDEEDVYPSSTREVTWASDLLSDLARVGQRLRSKGMFNPSDGVVKVHVAHWIPRPKWKRYESKNPKVWLGFRVATDHGYGGRRQGKKGRATMHANAGVPVFIKPWDRWVAKSALKI